MTQTHSLRSHARVLVAIVLLLGMLGGIACTKASGGSATASPQSSGTALAPSSSPSGLSSGSSGSDIHTAISRLRPATVQITNEQVQVDQFNQPFTVPAGVGSGFIYDKDGHVLTNNHVVAGAKQLEVALPDGSSFTAKLVGTDPQTDLAVLQISGSSLPVANLGDSAKVQVGDTTVAIGNALGLDGGPTVTSGVVSALGRSTQEPGDNGGGGPFLFDLVQTDAAINPGNSGGPLANSNGDVIGVNTLVAGQAEPGIQAQGIGFAISINSAKSIAEELVKNGSVKHAYLGVAYVPLNAAIAAQVGTTVKSGALVTAVASGSPAAAAGILPQDIITQVDGQDIKGESGLAQAIASHKPGDRVTLTVVRSGTTKQIDVTLGTQPA